MIGSLTTNKDTKRVDNDQIKGVLGEQLLGQLQAIQESVRDVPKIFERLDTMDGRFDRIEARLGSVEIILTEHTDDLREIKQILGGQMETITELKAASHTH